VSDCLITQHNADNCLILDVNLREAYFNLPDLSLIFVKYWRAWSLFKKA